MKKGPILVTVLVLLAVNLTVLAQDEERDIVEMGFFGGLGIPGSGLTDWKTGGEFENVIERAAKTGFDIGMDVGYFLRPNLVVGLNFIYTQFPIDTGDKKSSHQHRLYNPNLYVKFLFEGESNWTPYLKGHVGLENPKFSTFAQDEAGEGESRFRELSYDPAIAFGLGVGLIYYTAYYSGIFIEANYHQAFSKNAKATYLEDSYKFGENLTTFDIHAGIRILFSSGG